MRKSLIAWLFLLVCAPLHALTPTAETLRLYCETIQQGPGHNRIASVPVLTKFYARRGFRPVWDDRARMQVLLDVLASAGAHGLDPDDYHYLRLSGWNYENESPRQQAERDILATDALIRYSTHLYFGKLDPATLDPDWNLTRQVDSQDPVALLEDAVAAPSLQEYVDTRLAPNSPFYTALKQALADYRAIACAGGWPEVPDGPTLRPGDESGRVMALRARLAVTDAGFAGNTGESPVYDVRLWDAVRRFQRLHGLAVDGLVGRRTLRALNVPVQVRIDQLRVNLERTRWVFRNLESRYLIVNIAGFRAYVMDHGRKVWNSRVVVGTPFRKTPVFRARLTYLVLNPAWTVPPTILKEDVIPAMQQDPDYLASQNMVLLDGAGRLVEPSELVMDSLSADYFPYVVRQEPGPKNALGRIKFMFPNAHFVYLHDTPSRSLFQRASRTFSSGCIRVEHPLTLAELLLDDPVLWGRSRIEAQLAQSVTQTVYLHNPITVFLVYWTAAPGADGTVEFFNDVYARDAAVLKGLDEPLRSDGGVR